MSSNENLSADTDGSILPGCDEIDRQLHHMLENRRFRRSSQRSALLTYLVTETLANRVDQLSEYMIAVGALKRPPSFDALADSSVRVQISRLRKSLEYYYRNEGRNDPVEITLPFGSYQPLFKYRSSVNKKIDSLPRIAVLPFTDISSDISKSEHIITGMCENLTLRLAQYDRIAALSFRSSQRFSHHGDLKEIGVKLGADYLLTGMFMRNDDQIRVSVHLASSETREVLWTETFQGRFSEENFFGLIDRVVDQTAAKIADDYGIISRLVMESALAKNPEQLSTFDAIALAYHHLRIESMDSFKKALLALEQAIKLEPNNSLALGLLCALYFEDYALDRCQNPDALLRVETCSSKTIRVDPQNPWANFNLAILSFQKNDVSEVRRYCAEAIKSCPNASWIVGLSGWILILAGDVEPGMELLSPTLEDDPYHPRWLHTGPCFAYYQSGAFDLALEEAEAIQLPELFWDPLLNCICLARLERMEEAKVALNKLIKLKPDFNHKYRQYLEVYMLRSDWVDNICTGLELAGLDTL